MTAGHTPATSEHAPTPGTELEGIRQKVFLDRYALKGEDGTPLEQHPEQMWRRVARGIAAVEPSAEKRAEWEDKFYGLLSDFKFVPGGRILSGAGTGHEVTYYNCYVVGLGEDPLNPDAPRKPMLAPDAARPAFFNALSQMTDIMSRSGGVGINLSALPPRGTPIAAEGRGAHGPVRPTVALSLAHPDVERLLDEKDGPNLAHVDVAVIVPPAFDAALAADGDWTPRWGEMAGATVKARALWARVTDGDGKKVAILRPDAAMLTIEDSRDAIVAGAAAAARLLYQGTAPVVDFSPLRPKGAYIKTVNGTSSGPVAWMYLYDAVGRLDDGAAPAEKGVVWFGEIASVITGKTIQQGGSRRGALMLMLDDDHPDIEEFIRAKRIGADGRPVMIEHANMSVCASDAFMAAVKADLPWDLKWQGQVVRTVRAREIWDAICTAAWTTAEPGLVFMERAQKEANTWYFENIRCVNPCGEQPLPAGGVCNLGAINLERYVDADGRLLEDDLARDAAHATRFLDDVIDATPYFSELHVKMQREGTRRTGLGTMGLADALIKMQVAYGSAESEEAIDRIYGIIRDASYGESVRLAAEKGSFGRFDQEKYLQGRFIKRLPHDLQEDIREHGIRNGVILTQAPTGTTSLLAGVSSGIEPVFDFAMKRVDRLGEHIIYHPLLEAWMQEHPGEERPAYFVGAKDLTPEEHVVVQAKVQEYTDSSISKCVTGETLVASERGLLPIADLYAGEAPDAFRTLPLRVASLQGEQTASHFYYGGKRPALAVRLADGRAISGTGNHCIYVGDAQGLSWKRLDGLAPGDYVAVKIGAQRFGTDVPLRGFEQSTTRAGYQKTIQVPASMNPMLAHFIGAWCAEGSISHYTVRITNNERAVLERLNDEARLLFGIEGTTIPQGNSNALTLSINSKSLCELLRFLGCRDGAHHKVVPWSILQSSRESVIAFLSGLYLDGYVTPAKVGICLASRVMIEQVQIILDNLGVQSWITPKHNKVYARDYYELNAHGQEGQKLARLLAFDETHKVERARRLLQRSFGASRTDVIPLEARESVFGAGSGASRTVRYRHHAYSQVLSGQHEGRMLSWGGLRRLANDPEVALTADLRAIVENNLHFRQVLSVQDAGVQEVYDLTVPANQAFVANGIVNHNTANAPHDHTVEEVKRLYTLAYDLGCKGVTYYRDGSRDAVLTSVTEARPIAATTPDAAPALTTPDDGATAPAVMPAEPTTLLPEPAAALPIVSSPAMPAWMMEGRLKRRPSEMAGFTRNVAAPEGKVNITINQDDDGPLEVFINIGRAGSDVAALAEGLGRLISLQLRLPSTMSQEERLRQVANQLRGIGGSRSIGFGANRVQSLPDAVAQAIYRHLEEHPVPPPATPSVPAAQLALPVSETLPLSQAPLFPAGNPVPSGGTAPTATSPMSSAAATATAASVATATAAATPIINGNGHGKPEAAHVPVAVLTGNLCPQCGSSGAYVYEEGCKKCHNCGYSEC